MTSPANEQKMRKLTFPSQWHDGTLLQPAHILTCILLVYGGTEVVVAVAVVVVVVKPVGAGVGGRVRGLAGFRRGREQEDRGESGSGGRQLLH
ncbi:hypothetical protein E2C01_032001 [Portunus trituberculatus]|uniref:Uncharacterized protein n=1 Tax=Portunus trituberculatus TaxID=210409 RepID=A0A5B7F1M2_PORTR|nr:hypothetical protein [Portunus trituberculatus]